MEFGKKKNCKKFRTKLTKCKYSIYMPASYLYRMNDNYLNHSRLLL